MRLRTPLFLAVVLLATVASGAVGSAGATTATSTQQCKVVVHDAYRDDNATVDEVVETGEAVSKVENTRTTLAQSDGFYKVSATNPNAYCVQFRVLVHEEAMTPADLPGDVRSNDGSTNATWQTVHNFNTSTTYTRIGFRVAGGENVTFAPSRARIVSLSWVDAQQRQAEGFVAEVRSRLDDSVLEERKYKLRVDRAPTSRTVRLEHPDSGATITEYHAMYSTDDGETWKPVATDTEVPVYKTESEDAVTFHWTDRDAVVRFTANPNVLDDARHEVDAYMGGIDLLGGLFGGDEGGENA